MLVTVGIQNLAREVRVETEATEEAITAAVTASLTDGAPLVIESIKGNKTYIPAATIAYVEVGPVEKRSVGFAQF